MRSKLVETNGIHLNVIQEGPVDGDLIILLHGFPEFSYSWRKQIPALTAKGYRVWAPDQRGYNLSDKPEKISAYSMDELAKDVIGLVDAAGVEQTYLVGHDWGASVAWWTAIKHPEKIKKMIVMNVPHGKVFKKHLKSNFRQLIRSWYMFFFQLPWLPELLARRKNWRLPTHTLLGTSNKGTFKREEIHKYQTAWSQEKAYRSMLNWYRAMFQNPPSVPESARVIVPTLLIWGENDGFLGKEMAQPSIDLCDNGKLWTVPDATHWIHHEKPDEVNRLILDFFHEYNE